MDVAGRKANRMTRCYGCGWPHLSQDRLKWAVWAAEHYRDAAARLPDHVVYALHRWNDGRSAVIAAEIEQRRQQ
jgi:hypothetical protein